MQSDAPIKQSLSSHPVVRNRSSFLTSRRFWTAVWLVFLQLFMTVLVISFLVPTLWMITSSLKASTEVFAHPIQWLPKDPQWSNYAKAFSLLPLTTFIKNTFIIVVFAVLGTVISSALVAYSFSRINWPGRSFWFGLLLATMMLPDVVTLVPRFLIFKNLKWLDTFLPLIVPYWGGIGAIYVFLMRPFFLGMIMGQFAIAGLWLIIDYFSGMTDNRVFWI